MRQLNRRSLRPIATRSRWLVVVVAALGTFACAPKRTQSRVVTSDPQEIVQAPPEDPTRPHVRAGAMLTLRMLNELDTRSSRPGDRFEAAIVDPLRGVDGAIVVPSGAVVRGSVERVQKDRGFTLALDAVRIGSQDVPIDARVEAADLVPSRTSREGRTPYYSSATATFPAGTGGTVEPRYLEPEALRSGAKEPVGGDLALPIGAKLYLVLTRPILP